MKHARVVHEGRTQRAIERDGLIRRERDPADQRRTVVEATTKGRKLVDRLSNAVEAHYQWMENTLGKQKLGQLYQLLDELIELEQPGGDACRVTKPGRSARRPEATA